MNIYTGVAGVAGVVIGYVLAVVIQKWLARKKVNEAREESRRIVEDARLRAENLVKEAKLEAKDRLFKMKSDFDAETADARKELKRLEQRLISKEENLDKKFDQMERREQEVVKKEKRAQKIEEEVEQKQAECDHLLAEQKRQLEVVSGLTAEQAKEILVRSMEDEARHDAAKLIKKITTEAEEEAVKKAQKIISTAIHRYAGDYVAEKTVSVVELPGDEMKGRIIGREGRNIRALEAATGIDLIIDDTPEAVILSGFNPVRREVARISIQRLIADGRIHPARIEDVVKKVEVEVAATIKEAGEQAAFDLGVHGINPELVRILGSLKFRTSYTQNVLQHSIEVGFLCGIMAAELGLDQKLARRMGLLHDIGKAIDHEVEGPHALIGSNVALKYGESAEVAHAIAAHHEDVEPQSAYDVLVQASDALSGARPGARKELLENYIKRLEDLEKIANAFKGVATAYAIQAGRELRVMVEGDALSDEESVVLSRNIAKQIEENLTFPGQIKVTVIRETRAVEYANK
ncbi:MAG: ribonuclease Y [Thermodesulfobacteriota bacterium]|nr:ribonuclease Y [Thermodesulfobacteriota bacterium]